MVTRLKSSDSVVLIRPERQKAAAICLFRRSLVLLFYASTCGIPCYSFN